MAATTTTGTVHHVDVVRQRVAQDEVALRRQMANLVRKCRCALRGELDREQVVFELRRLQTALLHHLDYEQRELVPLLRDSDPWGPTRVERLLAQHEVQRRTLAALIQDVQDESRSLRDVIAEIEWFVRDFARDFAQQERGALAHVREPSDVVVVDQIDG